MLSHLPTILAALTPFLLLPLLPPTHALPKDASTVPPPTVPPPTPAQIPTNHLGFEWFYGLDPDCLDPNPDPTTWAVTYGENLTVTDVRIPAFSYRIDRDLLEEENLDFSLIINGVNCAEFTQNAWDPTLKGGRKKGCHGLTKDATCARVWTVEANGH